MSRSDAVEWIISDQPVAYPDALAFMDRKVAAIAHESENSCVWLLEHPPLYTAGTGADLADLLWPDRFPVYAAGRGGKLTYHGPGQRVAYAMVDLRHRGSDVRRFVRDLEAWLIRTLEMFGVRGERREGRIGIWVVRDNGREDKIAAIGVRVRRWVSFHGVSLNVDPDLDHFQGIVPCGLRDYGVTSLWDLGLTPTMDEVDLALKAAWSEIFGEKEDSHS